MSVASCVCGPREGRGQADLPPWTTAVVKSNLCDLKGEFANDGATDAKAQRQEGGDPEPMSETIADLEQRFAQQGVRVTRLTERLQQDMAQVKQTLIELRDAEAALKVLIEEAVT